MDRKAGKTVTVHIPKALAETVEQYCQNWKQYKEYLEEKTHETVIKLLESHQKKG